jgi:hypothetical protein
MEKLTIIRYGLIKNKGHDEIKKPANDLAKKCVQANLDLYKMYFGSLRLGLDTLLK